ncbi:MAG: leucine-rich repeat domain-containing protein [Candidatus Absconditabacterales bacterium]
MILLFIGFFGALYHTQEHASAAGPAYINPTVFCSVVTQIPQQECWGVVSIYNDTDGVHWTNNTNRGTTLNVCSWNGIVCGIPGHVTHIDLVNNNLVGNISSNIQLLDELIAINVSYNSISNIDTIPGNKLTKLLGFNASHNNLGDIGGLDSLPYLATIKNINLGYNNISKIPGTYVELVDTLTDLNLSYNHIDDIRSITNAGSDFLLTLFLAHNLINEIPSDIGDLKAIEELDLSKNLIDDKTVRWVGDLGGSLIYLNLAHNRIENIPDTFSNFVSNNILLSFDMSYNYLRKIIHVPHMASLLFLNLANNRLEDIIPLSQLTSLQTFDYGFNQLTKFPIEELLSIRNNLQSFSLRHNLIEGQIPSNITDMVALQNNASQIDYNRLEEYNVTDPTLITFLDTKFADTTSAADYLNTNRPDQYRSIQTETSINLDTVGNIYGGDTIQVTVGYKNLMTDRGTSGLDLSIFDVPGVFIIQNPTGFPMKKNTVFDNSDLCKKDLSQNTAGKYFDVLTTRATQNGWSSFVDYLRSSYRDYDLYDVTSNNEPYLSTRGEAFIKRIEQYTYDAFPATFQGGLFSWLFDFDLNDYAIDSCGVGGDLVTSYDRPVLAASTSDSVTFDLVIDSNFFGNFDFKAFIESNDRLYIQSTPSTDTLTIFVEEPDTDSDGIGDSIDNCILVPNPLQEDSNAIVGDTVVFTKIDGADRNLLANQDCITANVCITRQDNKGIYNAITESGFNQIDYSSPADTERAYGSCIDYNSLSFSSWNNNLWTYPGGLSQVSDMVGKPMCLHLITDNKYFDLTFDAWTIGGGTPSGGFAYTRTEYLSGVVNLGDACDCTDSICTTGNDINSNLICDPVDPICPIPPSCGDGNIDSGEQCDPAALSQPTCSSQGYDGGSLTCSPSCTIDTSSCFNDPVCGNNIIETGEECDGSALSGQTCGNFGYSLGTLSCNGCISFNTGACSNPPPVTPPSGGGGGGGSNPTDNCPNGDYSLSYYDHLCGTQPTTTTSVHTAPTNKLLIRSELAGLLSSFAMNVLNLVPDQKFFCNFSDITYLSAATRLSIRNACQLKIMGYNEDGALKKVAFNPNDIVTYNMLATALSRTIYDGTYNFALNPNIPWYQPHVIQLEKAGILSKGMRVTQNNVINILSHIKDTPSLVKRSGTNIGHAASPITSTGNITTGGMIVSTVITTITTSLSNSIRALLLDLSRFFTSSNNISTFQSPSINSQSTDKEILKDLGTFF